VIHPETRIGHIHLRVSNLERSIAFYRDVLGFELKVTDGAQAAFLSAGGYHHHIGLNTWGSKDGSPPPKGSTGLYHFAILLPNRRELARTYKRLLDHGVQIVSVLYCAALVVATFQQARHMLATKTTFATLDLPMWPGHLIVSIGLFLTAVMMLIDLGEVRKGRSSLVRAGSLASTTTP